MSGFLALVDLSRRKPTLSIADMSPVRAGAVYCRRSEVDYWNLHPVAISIWTKSGSVTFNRTWKPERKSVRSAGAAISTWAVSASSEPSPGRDKPWSFYQFSFWGWWRCWRRTLALLISQMVDMRRLPSRWMCNSTRERGWKVLIIWGYTIHDFLVLFFSRWICFVISLPWEPLSFWVPETWALGSLACSSVLATVSCNSLFNLVQTFSISQ